MIISYDTDIGLVRRENQDSVYAKQIDDNSALLIVADGMGGHSGGKKASSSAIENIAQNILSTYKKSVSQEEIEELLRSSVSFANQSIYDAAFVNSELKGMGTTVVVALVIDNILYTANVGDSRLYVYTKGELNQITTDHSYVESLVSKGIISKAEAKTHPKKNIITRAVGSDEIVDIDIFKNELSKDDVILLCTDGLYGLVNEEEIKEVLNGDIENAATKLVDMANENGGKDNISVITVKIN